MKGGILLFIASILATLIVMSSPLETTGENYPILAVTIGVGIVGLLMIFGIIGNKVKDKDGK